MQMLIEKQLRRLSIRDNGKLVFQCRIALGRCPEGAKTAEGDGRTPEGVYRICLVKEQGKYGRSLGLNYPGETDAQLAFAEGRIDKRTLDNILLAHQEHRRPPWGSPLGGEIYLHEGGTERDWTQGCIALNTEDMDVVFPLWEQLEQIEIQA